MKILVFGGHGQAGTEFLRLAAEKPVTEVAPTRSEVDIRAFEQLHQYIAAVRPAIVINLAAFHVLEECERAFLDAMTVNAVSVREMALAANRVGARLITVSTDYVFDGKARMPYGEEDEALPIQAYGVSKRAGELAALVASDGEAIIARTCGLYGLAGSRTRGMNFVERRIAELSREQRIEVGDDLRCTPTSALAFSEALLKLAMMPDAPGGIYHLTAEGDSNWAEFTREIGRLANLKCEVVGVDRHGDYGVVKRPAYSVLGNRRAASLGIRLPDWREALERYLAARENR